MTAVTTFFPSCQGIALGKIPGLVIARVDVALLGAIAMVWRSALFRRKVPPDRSTFRQSCCFILFMIISAQLRLGGFCTCFALKIVPLSARPRVFLLVTMLVNALLSAVPANDIVCFAFTPALALSLVEAGL